MGARYLALRLRHRLRKKCIVYRNGEPWAVRYVSECGVVVDTMPPTPKEIETLPPCEEGE